MKKLALGMIVAAVFGSASFAQSSTSNGTIRFTGEVLKAACTVAPVTDINLGSAATKTLDAAGKSTGWATGSIVFYDCDTTPDASGTGSTPISAVNLAIPKGTADSTVDTLWANLAGDAKNVGLELKVNNKNVTPAGETFDDLEITASGVLRVPVQARMQATGAATEGTFITTVAFTATYK